MTAAKSPPLIVCGEVVPGTERGGYHVPGPDFGWTIAGCARHDTPENIELTRLAKLNGTRRGGTRAETAAPTEQ